MNHEKTVSALRFWYKRLDSAKTKNGGQLLCALLHAKNTDN
jgi:hypothetical protein